MIETYWWVPWLLFGVGVVLGALWGAKLTTDTLREIGWAPVRRLFARVPDEDVMIVGSGTYEDPYVIEWVPGGRLPPGTDVFPRAATEDEPERPSILPDRGVGAVKWESPTVVSWPHLGERR